MTPTTKKEALVKLHAIADKIGYPDHWRDYSALTIVRGDALGNSQRSNAFEFHRQMAKIGKPVDKSQWEMTPPTVNAYYDPLENNINFPAGILQPPFYSAKADAAVNFGGAGAVIGHELTHGFDDQGRQFDARGNLKDWWTPADAKSFEERAQCFVDEYAGFTAVDEVKLNGKLTLGENTADNGGLRIALMAYLARDRRVPAGADARRLHARAARVPRLGPGVVRERPPRTRADAGADQPALARPRSRERRRLEHAGVPEGVRVQGRRADGAQEPVPGVVTKGAFDVRRSGSATNDDRTDHERRTNNDDT